MPEQTDSTENINATLNASPGNIRRLERRVRLQHSAYTVETQLGHSRNGEILLNTFDFREQKAPLVSKGLPRECTIITANCCDLVTNYTAVYTLCNPLEPLSLKGQKLQLIIEVP